MDSLIEVIHEVLTKRNVQVVTAESCTSGLLAAALTETPGSSVYYVGGVNVYANTAKERLLGVPPEILEQHGAVSSEVAAAMASGIRRVLPADVAISLTGIAGPGGGTAEKPVGTVWLGIDSVHTNYTKQLQLSGDRQAIRAAAVHAALEALQHYLEKTC